MLGVHHAAVALRLVLLAVLVRLDYDGLVVAEQHDVRPFLYQRGYLVRGLAAELHFPAVVAAHFVRLLELPESRVRGQCDIYPGVYHLGELVQKLPEALLFELPALAVAEILDTGFAVLCAEVGYTELLRPIHGVNYEGRAGALAYHEIQLLEEHFPA